MISKGLVLTVVLFLSFMPSDTAAGQHTVVWKYLTGSGIWDIDTAEEKGLIVAASFDNHLYVLFNNGSLKWKYPVEDFPYSVAVSADGKVAAGSKDRYIYFLDESGELKWKYKTSGSVWSVAMPKNGEYLLAGSYDKYVYFLDYEGNLRWKYLAKDAILGTAVSMNGRYAAAGAFNGKLYLFDSMGKLQWKRDLESPVLSISISPRDDVAASTYDGDIYLFNLKGDLLWKYGTLGPVQKVVISEDGRYLVAGSYDGFVYYFNSSGEMLWRFQGGDEFWDVSITRDGKFVAAGSRDKSIYFLNSTGGLLDRYTTKHYVPAVALAGNGEYAIAGSYDSFVYYLKKEPMQDEFPRIAVKMLVSNNIIKARENATVVILGKNIGSGKAWNVSISSPLLPGLKILEGENTWQGVLEAGESVNLSYKISLDKNVRVNTTYQLPPFITTYQDTDSEVYNLTGQPTTLILIPESASEGGEENYMLFLAVAIAAAVIGVATKTLIDGSGFITRSFRRFRGHKSPKILVVDDEQDIVKVLNTYLTKEGFKVEEAFDGGECLLKVGEDKPDIILLDVMLPGIDGWEVCRKIKENPTTKSIFVSMLTVRGSPEDRKKSYIFAKADAHLTKPVSLIELKHMLRGV